ncbi:TetR/AcrR family transcriptional regulator [Agreia pratensis]|uniref:TetR/AcrR family transcriptional regulator n=1 Tax=Microbacteriaceae TaxID=85023 RepID=UPI00188B657D|nr:MULTISPECIES: TetR/AcrR family transcriptional regulator [Microbacteriaceae]MBF4561222.1 TetR/AcrR family transcriptional regulator [Microbacterium sp. VKM Ac-2870]MBF4633889.1 TetR/AcrR family transcriptional regulator [Agreia pratensis]
MSHDSPRSVLLEAVVNHILAEGSTSPTLRDLAAAAGSNNRMLLYYFESKDQLVGEALDAALLRYPLIKNLDERMAETGLPIEERLLGTWRELSQPENLPFIRLLIESVIQTSRKPHSNSELLRHFNEDWAETVAAALAEQLAKDEARLVARRIVAVWRGLQLDLVSGGDPEWLNQVHESFVESICSEHSIDRHLRTRF